MERDWELLQNAHYLKPGSEREDAEAAYNGLLLVVDEKQNKTLKQLKVPLPRCGHERKVSFAKQVFGKIAVDMNPGDLYSFFVSRVKEQLHVVLAFSPIGGAFRDRLCKYPSLINCCTINWFTSWPKDSLMEVKKKKPIGARRIG